MGLCVSQTPHCMPSTPCPLHAFEEKMGTLQVKARGTSYRDQFGPRQRANLAFQISLLP